MALSAWCTSYNTGTGAVGTTVSITGQASQPKVVFHCWNGRTGTVDANGRGTHARGIGAAISTSDRRRMNSLSQDTPTAMVTNHSQDDAECVALSTTADLVDGLLDHQSMNSDGWTGVVDDVFVASYRVHALGLGGADLANVVGGDFTKATTTGVQQITSLSFQPDGIIFFTSGQTTMSGSVNPDSACCIGAATSATEQFVWSAGSNDGAANAQSVSYCTDAECIALLNSGATGFNDRATFVQFLSNGFEVNWTVNAAGSERIPFIAFKGCGIRVVSGLTQTDTSTDVTFTLPFTVRAGMVFSHALAESSAGTVQDDDKMSWGFFSSTSDERCMSMADDDAAGTAVVSTGVSHDAVYQNLDPATGNVQGEMVVQSMSGNTVAFRMSDADPSQAFFAAILFGDRPLAPPPFQRLTRIMTRRI